MINFSKRYMKHLSRISNDSNLKLETPKLFRRYGAGIHAVLPIHEGLANDVVASITHSDYLSKYETVPCDFSSISDSVDRVDDLTLIKKSSFCALTIISHDTHYKNNIILAKILKKSGLLHENEQYGLVKKLMLQEKLKYISNEAKLLDSHILYQTKKKIEIVSLNDKKRLIELIGVKAYEQVFEPFTESFSQIEESRLPIVDILLKKSEEEGIGSVLKILESIT